MQRRIDEIRREIMSGVGKTAWDKGVRGYAEELFDYYLNECHITDEFIRIGKIKEKDLLNGAGDWNQYSRGGCAEIYDSDICDRLYSTTEKRRSRNGEKPPNEHEAWLDVQARALSQAARIVLAAVNRRDEQC